MERLTSPHSDVIDLHEEAGSLFDGYAVTIGELAKFLIENSLPNIRTLGAFKDKAQADLLDLEALQSFPERLCASTAPSGIRIPLKGPSMVFRKENEGVFSLSGLGTIYLSGYVPGVHLEVLDNDAEGGTIDQLRKELELQLHSMRQKHGYQNLPDLPDLDLHWNMEKLSRGWHNVSFITPFGRRQALGMLIKAHSGLHTIRAAAQKLAGAIALHYVHPLVVDEQRGQVRSAASEATKGQLDIESIEIKNIGSRVEDEITFDYIEFIIFYSYLDDHLNEQRKTFVINKPLGDHLMKGMFDPLKKLAQSQNRRKARPHVEMDIVTARHACKTRVASEIGECFHDRLALVAGPATYETRDGLISITKTISKDGKIAYDRGVLRIRNMSLPETAYAAMRGQPVERLVEHPLLSGTTIRYIRQLKDEIAAYLEVPSIDFEGYEEMTRQAGDVRHPAK